MLGIEIWTSKTGRLWPTEYWKTLIDALGQGGAKHDPRLRHPDLAKQVDAFVEIRGGRHYSSNAHALASSDDAALRLIVLHRTAAGSERIVLGRGIAPSTGGWPEIRVPFFGTIGDSVYEAQPKLNRDAIEVHFQDELRELRRSGTLGLHFQLSVKRKDRDLENLADGLMPVFNRYCTGLAHMCLVKDMAGGEDAEILRISTGMDALASTGVSAP